MDKIYTLDELAAEVGISEAAIRYYIREGLLEGPETRGRYARYTENHLARLRKIHELAERHRLKVPGVKQQLMREAASVYIRKALASLQPNEIIAEPVARTGDTSGQEVEIGEIWKRIPLAEGVEILFRYPANLEIQTRINRTIAYFHSTDDQDG